MELSKINSYSNVHFASTKTTEAKGVQMTKFETPADSVSLTKTQSKLTTEEKQEIVRQARTTASGWAIFGGPISTLYFGLRSDKKVAKKYDLDAQQDKALIKNIKNQQMLWTLPSLIPGFGFIPGIVAWLYNKNMDASKINA